MRSIHLMIKRDSRRILILDAEDMVQTLSSQFEDLSNAVKDISRALNMESRSTCALNLNN